MFSFDMLQLLNFSCMWMLVKFRMPVCRWQIQSNERHKSEVVGASITFCLIPQKILNMVATAKMGYAPKMAMEWRRWGPKWPSNNGDNGDIYNGDNGHNENKASGTWHVAATGSTPQDSQPYDGTLRATFDTCAIFMCIPIIIKRMMLSNDMRSLSPKTCIRPSLQSWLGMALKVRFVKSESLCWPKVSDLKFKFTYIYI